MTKAAFIGLGSMGAPQARLIARAGFELAVYDPFPAALQAFDGIARLATSSADAAAGVEYASICVRDDKQVLDVLFGANGVADALPQGALVLIHSTIATDTVRGIAPRLAERGIALVDAPVSRTRRTDDEPYVFSMLGGAAADVARARTIAQAYSTDIDHMGPLGAGVAAKIANNLVTWTQIIVAIQAAEMAVSNGVGADKLIAIMQANGNLTPVMGGVITGKFLSPPPTEAAAEFQASQGGIGEKDLMLALESAEAAGVDGRMIREAQKLVMGLMRYYRGPTSAGG